MLRNILLTAAVAWIMAPVVLTTDAMAGSSTSPKTGKQHARSAAHSLAQHRRQDAARRAFARDYDNNFAVHYAVPPKTSIFHGAGSANVPRLCAAQGLCD
jgi:succinylarginine dihydrolase